MTTEASQPVVTTGTLRVMAAIFESEISEIDGAREVLVTIIQPGVSRNGNSYSPEVIRRLVPLLEGAQAYADHSMPDPTRPNQVGALRSIRDLVGYYVRPYVDSRTGALKATLRLVEGQHVNWLWSLIKETVKTKLPLAGLSIEAVADVATRMVNGKVVREVENIARLLSCDVVSRASAGGRFDALAPVLQEADGGMGGRGGVGFWDVFSPAPLPNAGLSDGQSVVDGTSPPPPVATGPRLSTAVARGNQGESGGQTGRGAPIGGAQAGQVAVANGRPRDAYGRAIGGAGVDGVELLQPYGGQTNGIAGGQVIVGPAVVIEGGDTHVDQSNATNANAGTAVSAGAGAGAQAQSQATGAGAGASTGTGASTGAGVAQGTAIQEAERLLSDLRRERSVLECERLLDASLRESILPEAIKTRLAKRFRGRVFEATDLSAAFEDERTMLADLTSAGMVRGLGYEKTITVGLSERDKLQLAFDALFDIQESEQARALPKLTGLREAYILSTGDTQVSGNSSPERMAQLVREADITTSSFSYLLGTSMNKRLLKDYQSWPAEWQKFTTITPIKDFKQQDRIRLGAFGSLSTVAEDTSYSYLTLADTRAIYTPSKRGNLVAVTRETIVNDDLYSIKQIPGKLAVAAAFTLAEFVYQTLLNPNGGNIYDAHPLFDSVNHLNTGVIAGNLGTANSGSALTSANMQTGVIKMRKQQNVAGKPIGLKPRFLVVVPDLEFTAMLTVKSAGIPGSANNDINPMLGYCEVIVAPQINGLASNTVTQWMLIADPRVIDTLEIGFVGGQINPALFIQDQPLFGNNFTNDVITYKVRHEYGGAVVDYRGFYLGNN